ncbi:MAG: hypothetical protein J6V99_03240 [Neisseriaceae bacterium]|nr:hypothetical protein [Neisseriaceae bacterium]
MSIQFRTEAQTSFTEISFRVLILIQSSLKIFSIKFIQAAYSLYGKCFQGA